MGVVRREGDWRLDKQEDGVYEVTYDGQPEAKIITSDYTPDQFRDERNDFTIPVREVESFSEAKSVFQEMAQGKPTVGGVPGINSTDGFDGLGSTIDFDGTDEDVTLPPGGFLLVGFLAGGIFISQSGFNLESPVFLIGLAFLGLGVAMCAMAYRVYTVDGVSAAVNYLVSVDEDSAGKADDDSENGPEKTPPAPESLRNELYFERADQQCEWCETNVDSPDVHHIKPRKEGGPNEPENLIVLCPNCHRKADRGAIARSKLRYRVSSEMDEWERRPA